MAGTGLRDLKKARTRRHIADTAAGLFAERGYERVTVSEIARAAEVAEQTLYNYFPTKESLVTDREQQIQEELGELIRARPAGTSPAAAIRGFVLATVAAIRDTPPQLARGTLGSLAAVSPTVHRLALELSDRQATAFAEAISASGPVAPEIARLQGIALAGVFRILIGEAGRRTHQGQTPAEIADALHAQLEQVLAELDRWLTPPPPAP
ncbi:TetR/AcrR family transcriptional regulator [Dactylosporangium aurantiacum]|uniref:TetR/AcrR family transcriptional regulator n=1 Tax=Dactylosporangium aurantiacum TaxID=35754 RepID=A0A9Q9MR06_9ACTN|nr:TetR/AcrR family transcriptional regulator [Dactylosporangium aurantiacum]MDG6109926.1 TetR/AcrR family transcriptional regulator [Dactylosporangium aurantiacum]UWZ58077.1 TetR/AcrR family transcriptional regulator [Dactylosporangium aurantiacum]